MTQYKLTYEAQNRSCHVFLICTRGFFITFLQSDFENEYQNRMAKITFKALDANTAEIYLYGFIGFEITANDFANELRSISNKYSKVNVRINSGGGSVFEGIAIYNLIKQSKCEINIYIDGIAASMASVIAMSGNKIYMSKYARLMVHCPSGSAEGDSQSLRDIATQLDSLEKDLTDIYASRTGLPLDQVKSKFMQRGVNKWMNAQEALQEKLIDEIYDGPVVTIPAETSKLNAKEMFEFYNKINTNQKNETMKDLAVFIAMFAMAADSTAEQVVARMQKEVTDHKNAIKKISELEGKLKTFEDKEKEAHTKRVEVLIDGAIKSGKITADLKETYTTMATANFEATEKAIGAMKAYEPVHNSLNNHATHDDERAKWGFRDWMRNDAKGLEEMKKTDFEKFKKLYKAQYGTEYKG